jgi:hypothetical protein
MASASVSDSASSTDRAITPVRGTAGRSQPSGSSHTAYQGSSTGESSVKARRPHAQVAPSSVAHASASAPAARARPASAPAAPAAHRAVRTTSAANTTTNAAANTSRTAVSTAELPDSAPSVARKNRVGASHPSWVARFAMPSVGSSVWKNGAANSATSPPHTAACAASAPTRLPGGRRQTDATTSSPTATKAVAFTSAPSVRSAVPASSSPSPGGPPAAARSGRLATRASVAATASPTSRSLWPPPTACHTKTGFHPTSATANAALAGAIRPATRATTRTVAPPATAAMALNRYRSATGLRSHRVRPAESIVKAGPYTAGVSRHMGPTNG